MDTFAALHPRLCFVFFLFVLLVTMTVMHPAVLLISLLTAAAYDAWQRGLRKLGKQMLVLVPFMLVTVLLNALFNHAGVTILFYLPNGNPITGEAVRFGAAAGVMLAAVILWFACFNEVMSSDKLLFVCGRALPSLSLLLTMALRFVPRFSEQIRLISAAQRAIGQDASEGSVLKRIRCGARILSIAVTWALESGIQTADSMKSRGYGTGKRSRFSVYRFDRRDRALTAVLAALAALTLIPLVTGRLSVSYYPMYTTSEPGIVPALGVTAFALVCAMPMILNGKEALTWRRLRSTI